MHRARTPQRRREEGTPWKKWGPYLSERQWGTVREDYSADGNAWDYFTHDQSRSRVLIRVSVHNRGPEAARLHLLPTLWFRNTWSWGAGGDKPQLREAGRGRIRAAYPELGEYGLACDGAPEALFTENESNAERLWGQPNPAPWVKDAFHRYVVAGETGAVNPAQTGTKAAARYVLDVPAGGSRTVRLRLAAALPLEPCGREFDDEFAARIVEADEFYDKIGGTEKFQADPHWRDLVLFYENFHGDNGAGLGASHQTGWTGLVARLLDRFGRVDAETILSKSKADLLSDLVRAQVGGE